MAATLGFSDALIWPAFGLLILSLAEGSKTGAHGTMGPAWLVYLGEISCSVYMTHLPVDIAYFHVLDRIAPGISGAAAWSAWIGVFAATLIVSMATYHLVGRPARSWMRAHDPFTCKPQPEPPPEPII